MDNQKKEKRTVLVVEDDFFLVQAYQDKFEKEGVNVLTAMDGRTALSFLEKDPPDAVLLDLMLPGVNGFDVLVAIKQNTKWKSVPVIILTNLGQDQDMKRGLSLGANEYIVKANIKISDLVEKIKFYFK